MTTADTTTRILAAMSSVFDADKAGLEAIEAAEADLDAQVRSYIETLYVEEIEAGEFLGPKLEQLVSLQKLTHLQATRETQAAVELSVIHDAWQRGLFAHAGFESIYEWLENAGHKPRSGRFGQIVYLAVTLIPWCQHHGVFTVTKVINPRTGELVQEIERPVNLKWFKRFIGRKCLVNRARYIISNFRDLLDTDWSTPTKVEHAQLMLQLVENPELDNSMLSLRMNGFGEDPIQGVFAATDRNGAGQVILTITSQAQLDYVRRQLGKAAEIDYQPLQLLELRHTLPEIIQTILTPLRRETNGQH